MKSESWYARLTIFLQCDSMFGADRFESLDDMRRRLRRCIGVDELLYDCDAAALADALAVAAHGLHHGLAAVWIGVADIQLQNDAAGNAVDRAGMHVAGADGGYGVDGAGRKGVFFDGENELGCGAQRVFAVGHQERSSVAARSP